MRKIALFFLLFSTVFLTNCSATSNNNSPIIDEQPEQSPQLAIVLGDISDDPSEVIEGTQPLADYLAEQLSDYGFTEGQVKVATNADEMAEMLINGEVDIYFDSVYPATLISDATGATPFLRRWRFGVEEYYSVIFTSQDSGITSIEEITGSTIAFDNPFSTSGYLLPAVHLSQAGYQLTSGSAGISDEQIGFVFSYDDENTVQWVLSGTADLGATDDWNYYVAFPEDARDQLVVLAETDPVPRQVAVARPGIDSKLLDNIIEVLINMHEDESGTVALELFQTSKFDKFPEGIEIALANMREMMKIAQSIQLP